MQLKTGGTVRCGVSSKRSKHLLMGTLIRCSCKAEKSIQKQKDAKGSSLNPNKGKNSEKSKSSKSSKSTKTSRKPKIIQKVEKKRW